MNIVWFPTFRCQYQCAYCNTRALPVRGHGRELAPVVWSRLFEQCPQPIRLLLASGGEPGLYGGLRDALESAAPAPLHVNTNLASDPREWATEKVAQAMVSMTCSLHFDPDDERLGDFWPRVVWLRSVLRPETRLNVRVVRTQQVTEQTLRRTRERCIEARVAYAANDFSDHWAWRDQSPLRVGSARCAGGRTTVILLPDGTAYRCLGHAYGGYTDIGNVTQQGWDVLFTEDATCDRLLCSLTDCDALAPEWAEGSGRLAPEASRWADTLGDRP